LIEPMAGVRPGRLEMDVLEELRVAVSEGHAKDAALLTNRALEEGIPAGTILQEGLVEAMRLVGHDFEIGEIFVPEMMVSARAMNAALDVLKPRLVTQGVKASGKVAIGTVAGDVHDIGKNLVAMMLEGSGYEVIDLGVNVSADAFVAAINDGAQILGLSALLTTTMTGMTSVLEAIEHAGVRTKARVIVGGAPITQEYADAIGADGYAKDASSAVRLVAELLAR
jgi:5-methyltetrahydrofolate--homocysteine methyltransferase